MIAPDDLIAKGRRTGREGEAEGAKPGRIGGTNDGGNLLTLAPGGSAPAYVRSHGPVFGAAFSLLLCPTGNTSAECRSLDQRAALGRTSDPPRSTASRATSLQGRIGFSGLIHEYELGA
jgi:hypothetical protein